MNEQALQARIAELKALADAATPGPWRIGSLESYDGYSGKPYRNVWQGQDDAARIIARAILDQGNEQTDVDADAMFIAAAREAIPALLADLEEAMQFCRYKEFASAVREMEQQISSLKAMNAELREDLAATRKQLEPYKRDAELMNWLERMTGNVRVPLRYGSEDLFWACPGDDDGESLPSNIRSKIDASFAERVAP